MFIIWSYIAVIDILSENYQEAMRYDYTTSVDTEEDDELEGSKRKPKAKQFEDFITGIIFK